MSTARYLRRPSDRLLTLLEPGALLEPLLRPRVVHGLPLDLHFREHDKVQVYCGGTSLLTAARSAGGVAVTAHPTYAAQACAAPLLRRWLPGATGFAEALDGYLSQVQVRDALIKLEGSVQARWSGAGAPWAPIDREAALGYPSDPQRRLEQAFPAVAAATQTLAAHALAHGWTAPPSGGTPRKLDRLAIDPSGALVLLELKDAARGSSGRVKSDADLFYVPLQLLQYVHEWHAALPRVRADLHALARSRTTLGIGPALPDLSGALRPVIGLGVDHRSAEVRRRFAVAVHVANAHLPVGASPIELWTWDGDAPARVDL